MPQGAFASNGGIKGDQNFVASTVALDNSRGGPASLWSEANVCYALCVCESVCEYNRGCRAAQTKVTSDTNGCVTATDPVNTAVSDLQPESKRASNHEL